MIDVDSRRSDRTIRRIKGKKGTETFLVFDVESELIPDGFRGKFHKPFLICYQALMLSAKGKTTLLERGHCKTKKEFYAFLTEFSKTWKSFYLLAHNTRYDFGVIEGFKWFEEMKLKVVIFNPVVGAFVIIAKNRTNTVKVIDTFNFFSASLKNVGKDLGLEKFDMPMKQEITPEFISYCYRDVDIAVLALSKLSEICGNYEMGNLRITRASLAFDVFRLHFQRHSIWTHTRRDALQLEIDSYIGGRTEAHFQGNTGKDKKYYLDVNSLYPSVMLNNAYSVKIWGKFENISCEKLCKLLKNFNCVARIKVKTSVPCYPMKKDKDTIYPIGTFITTLAYPELQMASDKGDILEVYGGYNHMPQKIFDEYVTHFHGLKTKYKKEGQPVFTYFAKLMLNSLYGKFGQKIPVLEPTGRKSEKKYAVENSINLDTGEVWVEKIINHDIFIQSKKMISINSVPIIASEVTSYARVLMWKYISTCGIDNLYYSDTDSLITNEKGYQNLQKYIKNGELGFLELEKTSEHCVIKGLKDYEFGTDIHHKAVPKNATEIKPNVYEFDHWTTLPESLQLEGLFKMHNGKVTKSLKRIISKGLKLKNGHVIPWRLN